jgi:hypothetical protein
MPAARISANPVSSAAKIQSRVCRILEIPPYGCSRSLGLEQENHFRNAIMMIQ